VERLLVKPDHGEIQSVMPPFSALAAARVCGGGCCWPLAFSDCPISSSASLARIEVSAFLSLPVHQALGESVWTARKLYGEAGEKRSPAVAATKRNGGPYRRAKATGARGDRLALANNLTLALATEYIWLTLEVSLTHPGRSPCCRSCRKRVSLVKPAITCPQQEAVVLRERKPYRPRYLPKVPNGMALSIRGGDFHSHRNPDVDLPGQVLVPIASAKPRGTASRKGPRQLQERQQENR
jgi:hypothetical protein